MKPGSGGRRERRLEGGVLLCKTEPPSPAGNVALAAWDDKDIVADVRGET